MKHYTPDIPKLRICFSADEEYTKNVYAVKRIVREAVRATLYYEKFDADAEISVSFVTNETIKKLNAEYREKDSATDVLSFPMYTREEIAEIVPEEEDTVVLGDVVLSLERAAEQAEELGHGFLREVAFLTNHSVLHLLGYDHELSPEEDERQCAKQREIIEALAPDEDK